MDCRDIDSNRCHYFQISDFIALPMGDLVEKKLFNLKRHNMGSVLAGPAEIHRTIFPLLPAAQDVFFSK